MLQFRTIGYNCFLPSRGGNGSGVVVFNFWARVGYRGDEIGSRHERWLSQIERFPLTITPSASFHHILKYFLSTGCVRKNVGMVINVLADKSQVVKSHKVFGPSKLNRQFLNKLPTRR